MNEHDATELAFKNGYKQGTEDAVLKMAKMLKEDTDMLFDAYENPLIAVREDDIDQIVKELLGDTENGTGQIIKALECCQTGYCYPHNCPLANGFDDDISKYTSELAKNALSLIREQEKRIEELTEENNRLVVSEVRSEVSLAQEKIFRIRDEHPVVVAIREDTVRKMQAEIEERCIKGGIYPAFVARVIENVAKKILEGKNDAK